MRCDARQLGLRQSKARRAVVVCIVLVTLAVASPALAQQAGPSSFWEQVAGGLESQTDPLWTRLGLLLLLALVVAAHWACRRQAAAARRRALSGIERSLERLSGIVQLPDLLRAGDLVELEHTEEHRRRVYASRVQDVAETTVTLSAPRQESAIVPLRVGDQLAVVVRKRPYTYRYLTPVLERRSSPFPVIIVNRPHRVFRYQRREFHRAAVDLPCSFEGVARGRPAPAILSRTGRIVNISGSGCRVEAPRPHARASFAVLEFHLPEEAAPIRATAQIVGRTHRRGSHTGPESFGCHFIEIPRADRERIVRFVLESERRVVRVVRDVGHGDDGAEGAEGSV